VYLKKYFFGVTVIDGLTDHEVAWVGLTEDQKSKWVQTRWTSAKPSTLTPRWAKASRMAVEVAHGSCTDLPPIKK
jgi:hypothetical protein